VVFGTEDLYIRMFRKYECDVIWCSETSNSHKTHFPHFLSTSIKVITGDLHKLSRNFDVIFSLKGLLWAYDIFNGF
jgi:hypothetical protein